MAKTRTTRPCARSRLVAFDDQRIALAATATERGRADVQAPPLQLVGERQHQTRAARTDGMAERNRAAVHVDPLLVQLEHPGCVEGDRRERFVDLDQVEVAGLEAGFLKRVAQRQSRHGVQPRVTVSAHAVSDYFSERLDPPPARSLARTDT